MNRLLLIFFCIFFFAVAPWASAQVANPIYFSNREYVKTDHRVSPKEFAIANNWVMSINGDEPYKLNLYKKSDFLATDSELDGKALVSIKSYEIDQNRSITKLVAVNNKKGLVEQAGVDQTYFLAVLDQKEVCILAVENSSGAITFLNEVYVSDYTKPEIVTLAAFDYDLDDDVDIVLFESDVTDLETIKANGAADPFNADALPSRIVSIPNQFPGDTLKHGGKFPSTWKKSQDLDYVDPFMYQLSTIGRFGKTNEISVLYFTSGFGDKVNNPSRGNTSSRRVFSKVLDRCNFQGSNWVVQEDFIGIGDALTEEDKFEILAMKLVDIDGEDTDGVSTGYLDNDLLLLAANGTDGKLYYSLSSLVRPGKTANGGGSSIKPQLQSLSTERSYYGDFCDMAKVYTLSAKLGAKNVLGLVTFDGVLGNLFETWAFDVDMSSFNLSGEVLYQRENLADMDPVQVVSGDFDDIPGKDFLIQYDTKEGISYNRFAVYRSLYYKGEDSNSLCGNSSLDLTFTPLPSAKYSFDTPNSGAQNTSNGLNPLSYFQYQVVNKVIDESKGIYTITVRNASDTVLAEYSEYYTVVPLLQLNVPLTTNDILCPWTTVSTTLMDDSTVYDPANSNRLLLQWTINWGGNQSATGRYGTSGKPMAGGIEHSYLYNTAGNYTVTFTATDARLDQGAYVEVCTFTKTYNIVVKSMPTATFSPSLVCYQGSDMYFVNKSEGYSDTDYMVSWNFGDTLDYIVATGRTMTYNYQSIGTFTVTLKITELAATQCESVDRYSIQINTPELDPLPMTLQNTMLCSNLTITVNNLTPTVSSLLTIEKIEYGFDYSNAPLEVVEVPITAASVSYKYPTINASESAYNFLIHKQVYFQGGCTVGAELPIEVLPAPTIEVNTDDSLFCDEGIYSKPISIQVSEKSGVSGVWSNSANKDLNVQADLMGQAWMFFPNEMGVGSFGYWVSFVDYVYGCTATNNFTMVVNQTPRPFVESVDPLCVSTTPYKLVYKELTGVSLNTNAWYTNPSTSMAPTESTLLRVDGTIYETGYPLYTFTPKYTGNYTVTIFCIAKNGCLGESSIMINVKPDFKGVDLAKYDVCKGAVDVAKYTFRPKVLDISESLSFTWSSASPYNVFATGEESKLYPEIYPKITSLYTLKVYNSTIGCEKTLTTTLEFINEDPISVFTPNGDGNHDVWDFGFITPCPNCDVSIFARNGERIYNASVGESPDSVSWNGVSSKGVEMPVGTYMYVIKSKQDSNKYTSGTITILK